MREIILKENELRKIIFGQKTSFELDFLEKYSYITMEILHILRELPELLRHSEEPTGIAGFIFAKYRLSPEELEKVLDIIHCHNKADILYSYSRFMAGSG